MSETDKTDTGKTKVFVSYSRKDSAAVRKLVEGLEREDDIEVFRDTEDILPTEEWKERLEQLIGEADTIVFVLSRSSARSDVCRWEVDHAESLNKRIAPIVIRNVAPSRIPEPLTKYNYIFFTFMPATAFRPEVRIIWCQLARRLKARPIWKSRP